MRRLNSFSRRGFLTRTSACLALPALTYRRAFSQSEPPSEQVRVGCIGVGAQGQANLKAIRKQVVAVCDVDRNRLAKVAKEHEQAAASAPEVNRSILAVEDYRRLLDRKDLDAVLISTPDHWHALQVIHACQAGKDVYCEKPLSLTIAEGRAMVQAARQHQRIVQTGSQQRSGTEFRKACEWVRSGLLGEIREVLVGLPGPNWIDRAKQPVPDSPAPTELNFDLWLGPTPVVPYNLHKVHYLFRFFWAYSGGQQTNFGAHHLDIAQWGLDQDDTGPTRIEGQAEYHPQGWYETPDAATVRYTYANGVKLLCSLGKKGYPQGTTFVGPRGRIFVTRGKLEITLDGQKVNPQELAAPKVTLPVSTQHHQHWLACIKSRQKPICDVEIGHRSATVCHLGNLAIRLGRPLTWDPASESFPGDAEANGLRARAYRAPWSLA